MAHPASPIRLEVDCAIPKGALDVPHSVADRIGLNDGRRIHVILGNKPLALSIRVSESSDGVCRFSSTQDRWWDLPDGTVISGTACGRVITLDPPIGIVADERPNKPPYGEQNTLIERFVRVSRKTGTLVYAFTYPQPKLEEGSVYGRIPQDGWRLRRLPLPSVVYHRGYYTSEHFSGNIGLARELRRLGVRVFNSRIGDKFTVHRILSRVADLANHLPDTARVVGHETVLRFLRRYRDVYIKKVDGTQGRGVYRLRLHKGVCSISGFDEQGRRIECDGLAGADVVALVRSLVANRRYLVQQTIDVARVDGNPVDIRVLVQKDRSGQWQLAAVAARIAARGTDVCNLHRGASVLNVAELVRHCRDLEGVDPRLLMQRARETALSVASELERRYKPLGELGIDLAVDRCARLWFIEVNPKPGRSILKHLGDLQGAEMSLIRPIQYAKYLSKSSISQR